MKSFMIVHVQRQVKSIDSILESVRLIDFFLHISVLVFRSMLSIHQTTMNRAEFFKMEAENVQRKRKCRETEHRETICLVWCLSKSTNKVSLENKRELNADITERNISQIC